MSACASDCRLSKAVTNTSSSSSEAEPSSLHGARCNASSITPSAKVQDKPLPSHAGFALVTDPASYTLLSVIAKVFRGFVTAYLHRLLHLVHIFNLTFQAGQNHCTLQLAIHR